MFFRGKAVRLIRLSITLTSLLDNVGYCRDKLHAHYNLSWKSQELLMPLQSILLHIWVFLQLILIVQNQFYKINLQ